MRYQIETVSNRRTTLSILERKDFAIVLGGFSSRPHISQLVFLFDLSNFFWFCWMRDGIQKRAMISSYITLARYGNKSIISSQQITFKKKTIDRQFRAKYCTDSCSNKPMLAFNTKNSIHSTIYLQTIVPEFQLTTGLHLTRLLTNEL